MRLVEWEKLPEKMKNSKVKEYYDLLNKHRKELVVKRIADIVLALILLLILSPLFLVLSIWIKVDSKGPVMFRQIRVTQYGKEFRIHKFRTMVTNAEKIGSQVTTGDDPRVTKSGKFLRKYRLDEIAQLLDVLKGDMSFVGTRPEVPCYVEMYTDEMYATLLLPAGITSEASVEYKDESQLLDEADDIDKVYVEKILPNKMKYNLKAIRSFSIRNEIRTLFRTVVAVIK